MSRRAPTRWIPIALTLIITGAAPVVRAQGQGGRPPGQQQGLLELNARVDTVEGDVADLAHDVADLQSKTTLSDLDCSSTLGTPLAVFRGGRWQCADFEVVRETQRLPPGTREAFLVVTRPAGTLPFHGGAVASRFVPPAPSDFVMTQNGPGPSFNQWSAGWVSLSPTGITLETLVSVVVDCL